MLIVWNICRPSFSILIVFYSYIVMQLMCLEVCSVCGVAPLTVYLGGAGRGS